jgi:hypothetical protein
MEFLKQLHHDGKTASHKIKININYSPNKLSV